MRRIMVRYRVKADRLTEHLGFIGRVFDELRLKHPDGLRYGAFRLADGVSFVHLTSIETSDGMNPLTQIAAFKEFSERIKDRCDEPPVAVDLDEVATFRLYGA